MENSEGLYEHLPDSIKNDLYENRLNVVLAIELAGQDGAEIASIVDQNTDVSRITGIVAAIVSLANDGYIRGRWNDPRYLKLTRMGEKLALTGVISEIHKID